MEINGIKEIGLDELEKALHRRGSRIGMDNGNLQRQWFVSNGDGTADWTGWNWAGRIIYDLDDFKKEGEYFFMQQ